MTNEPESKTEPWIKQHGVKYPYAYDKGQKLFRGLGFKAYPSSALVDPSGKVIWTGHPAKLDKALIEKQLEGVLSVITAKWPDSAREARDALEHGRLGKALDEASKLAEQDAAAAGVLKDVRAIVDRRVKRMESLREQGDLLKLRDIAKVLDKELAGHPEGQKASEILKFLRSDRTAKATLRTQKKIDHLRQRAKRSKSTSDVRKIAEALDALAEHAEGYPAEEARSLSKKLKAQTKH